jgi:hypothetical protein
MPRTLSFIVLLLAALVLATGMAHLLEMPRKMQLTQQSYGAVQYIYTGWALLGIIQSGAVVATFLLYLRSHRSAAILAALICLILTLVVFFIWTYPVNRSTQNWSVLPVTWEALRRQWEYSHAANALLELTAYILLLSGILKRSRQPRL